MISKRQQKFIEKQKQSDPKYKTELCKTYSQTGSCKYGYKCRFAHGEQELIPRKRSSFYKKRICKTFMEKGFCLYGQRCEFIHNDEVFKHLKRPYLFDKVFFIKMFCGNNNDSNCFSRRLPVFEEITSKYQENFIIDEKIPSSKTNIFNEIKDDNSCDTRKESASSSTSFNEEDY